MVRPHAQRACCKLRVKQCRRYECSSRNRLTSYAFETSASSVNFTAAVIGRLVARGPDEWSRKRLELWEKGVLFDTEVTCSGNFLVRATRVDLAVYSGYFQTFFESQFEDASKNVVNIDGVEPGVLETIIRALYEKEVRIEIPKSFTNFTHSTEISYPRIGTWQECSRRTPYLVPSSERYTIQSENHYICCTQASASKLQVWSCLFCLVKW